MQSLIGDSCEVIRNAAELRELAIVLSQFPADGKVWRQSGMRYRTEKTASGSSPIMLKDVQLDAQILLRVLAERG
jgi:hypothetical protein